jgi:TrmH family RNA methyltransferase
MDGRKESKLGRHHALMRRFRALRRDASLRRSERIFVAEGIHLAREALRFEADIEAFFVAPRLGSTPDGRDLLAAIETCGVAYHETEDTTLDRAQDARSPQPVACLVRRMVRSDQEIEEVLRAGSLAIVLEGIQDPGNVGSLLRSADAAGCDLALVTGAAADPFHPRAVRATMGSIFRLPVIEEATGPAVERLRRFDYRLIGAAPRGGEDYGEAQVAGKVALVIGNEGAGISADLGDRLDRTLTIPLRSGVESLSVGAAAAVLLFEIARQRRP